VRYLSETAAATSNPLLETSDSTRTIDIPLHFKGIKTHAADHPKTQSIIPNHNGIFRTPHEYRCNFSCLNDLRITIYLPQFAPV
jgi:hypothetical protein